MPMTEKDNSVLTALFQHNKWANLKLLEFCENLTHEQLRATAVGTYGDILNTLPHIIGAELRYVQRVNGKEPPTPPLSRDHWPGFDELKQLARWTSDEMLQLAVSARADTLVREHWDEDKVTEEYPLASLMLQALNHGTEHRAQIATILTQLGLAPPEMDGWQFMVETGAYRTLRDPSEPNEQVT